MASETQSSNTVEFTTNRVISNQLINEDTQKVDNDILNSLINFNSDFKVTWKECMNNKLLRKSVLRNVINSITTICITQSDSKFDFESKSPFINMNENGLNQFLEKIPSNITCLLYKHRLLDEFNLILLLLIASDSIINYRLFRKIAFTYNDKVIFYILNTSNLEDNNQNILYIRLDRILSNLSYIQDEKERKNREEKRQLYEQIKAYSYMTIIGVSCVVIPIAFIKLSK